MTVEEHPVVRYRKGIDADVIAAIEKYWAAIDDANTNHHGSHARMVEACAEYLVARGTVEAKFVFDNIEDACHHPLIGTTLFVMPCERLRYTDGDQTLWTFRPMTWLGDDQ